MRLHASVLSGAMVLGLSLGVPGSGGDSLRPGPGACPTSGAVGLSLTDLLSCLLPGSAQRMFGRPPRPPMPAGCDTPVRGTWTQGHAVVDRVSRRGDRTVYESTLNWRWDSGIWEGGRSTSRVDVTVEPGGYAVVVGREFFEGTIAGRTGSMVLWDVGHLYPSDRYIGETYAIGGTEGLANIRIEGHGEGLLGSGGRWTQPSRMCFAD